MAAASRRFPKLAFEHAVMRLPLDRLTRNTALVLASFMNGTTGRAWPSADTMNDCGVSRRRLGPDLMRLEEAGVLRVDRRRGPRGANVCISMASFADDSNEVVLDGGRVLAPMSARTPRAGALDVTPSTSARTPKAYELTEDDGTASAHTSEGQHVHVEPSARTPGRTRNTKNTTSRSDGGGGGGSRDETPASAGAPSDGPCSPERGSELARAVRVLQDAIHRKASKVDISPTDRKLLDAISAKLDDGWTAEQIATAVTAESLPKIIGRPSALFAARIRELLTQPPTPTPDEPTAPDEQIVDADDIDDVDAFEGPAVGADETVDLQAAFGRLDDRGREWISQRSDEARRAGVPFTQANTARRLALLVGLVEIAAWLGSGCEKLGDEVVRDLLVDHYGDEVAHDPNRTIGDLVGSLNAAQATAFAGDARTYRTKNGA